MVTNLLSSVYWSFSDLFHTSKIAASGSGTAGMSESLTGHNVSLDCFICDQYLTVMLGIFYVNAQGLLI